MTLIVGFVRRSSLAVIDGKAMLIQDRNIKGRSCYGIAVGGRLVEVGVRSEQEDSEHRYDTSIMQIHTEFTAYHVPSFIS